MDVAEAKRNQEIWKGIAETIDRYSRVIIPSERSSE